MDKFYTESDLRELGMNDAQITAIMHTQKAMKADEQLQERLEREQVEDQSSSTSDDNVIQMHNHNVNVHMQSNQSLVPTTLEQISTYKNGQVVELPPFADGQPFVARMCRPSMLALVKSGKIPNSLLNQATSLFANGSGALSTNGKNSTSINDLYEVIDVIVDAALLEPTLKDIRSVGMELTDDQLMAIFSYTQRGIKALEQFRTI